MSSPFQSSTIQSGVMDAIELLDREDLLKLVKSMLSGGVSLTFSGKRTAVEIAKKVCPRVMRRDPKFHIGAPEEQSKNLLIEGENLQAMVTLYKYRGQVDLILTDPPFNTGQSFRYNDKWDTDPNHPDLGSVVTKEDGSRHTKWIKAMYPRLHMMKAMLKPGGVIAICIDDNELFHLGMMMDEVFDEHNRLGIINWQKTFAAKSDSSHVSTATEYVLIYAKSEEKAKTGLLERTEKMNSRYTNPDNDPNGDWAPDNLSAKAHPKPEDYGIQSPFTGEIHYPPSNRRWFRKKSEIKQALEEWGSLYEVKKDPNSTLPSLVIKGTVLKDGKLITPDSILQEARKRAFEKLYSGIPYPEVIFGPDGKGRPSIKRYLRDVKKGRVPTTFWADEDYETPFILDVQSWEHTESGHSQAGTRELAELIGTKHGFETVKPLKLFKKIIQIWCPNNGLVLDPYAGSGTTGHAVLELNVEAETNRRFILIEQGNAGNGDKYARSLTWLRLKNAITGERTDKDGKILSTTAPLGGGFEFRYLTKRIDAKTVLAMKRDELIDVVITSHWEEDHRSSPNIVRIDDPKYTYLVGKNDRNEGYFIIWNGKDTVEELNRDTYREVLKDAKIAGLQPPHHVYARYEILQSPNVRFWKIPDKILAHLGLNENSDQFNEDD